MVTDLSHLLGNGLTPVVATLILLVIWVGLFLVFRSRNRSGRTGRSRALQKHNIHRARQALETIASIGASASAGGQIIAYLRRLDPFVFEELILEAFQRSGYQIRRNPRYTGDGGIDGQVRINGIWCIIQAKRYSGAIRPQHVHDFVQLCEERRQPGVFVHTGRTGPRSRSALGRFDSAIFISGDRLVRLLAEREFQA